ncbi:thioredoxin domain-containing protein 16 [Discoglossus pictus]
MIGLTGFVILLLSLKSFDITKARNVLQELSPDTYYSSLVPGKASLLYFNAASHSSTIFLEELQRAVEPLQDYGIFVAKVNCIKEDIPKYCAKENAYLFRGTKLLREFPTDALFDVNAIVANVLFVLLYNEVKYITFVLELQNIENESKGKRNVVFVYVQAIGTPEHRAVMEVAFVYGSKYQFVLTTEMTVLENISAEQSSLVSAKLLFSHCKAATERTQECKRTILEQSLTILNIHHFLKIMEAPLVADISGDPDKVTSVHLQLGLPMVFIISQQETYEADKATAEYVAWQLLGRAGLAIILREKPDANIPLNSNVALKREENMPVKYMVLEETQQIVDLIVNAKKEQEENSEEKYVSNDQDVQDDEVAEAVYRDRKRDLPLHLVPSLTNVIFNKTLKSNLHVVVLFYMSWETISLTFLRSFVDIAVKYNDMLGVYMARVNCADWPDLCSEESVTSIPVVKIYKTEKDPLLYTGMMGTEELFKFIMLSKADCPLELSTLEQAESYLSGKLEENLLPYHNLTLLGIFNPSMKEEAETFIGAVKHLQGFAMIGIYSEENASVLSDKYSTTLPAILFSRHSSHRIHGISLQNMSAKDIIHILKREILEIFPEIRVENLPSLLTGKKPLLVLFSDGNLNHNEEKCILSLQRGNYLDQYMTCWLNLKNTPVGYGILKQYFSSVPALPLLVLINFDAMGKVFAFPSDQYLTEVNILYWLEMIKAGEDQPVYILSNEEWKPPLPDYDFLAVMDATIPDFAAQKIRIRMKSSSRSKSLEDYPEVPEAEDATQQGSGTSLRGTVPKFIEREKRLKHHSEL